MSRPKKDKLVPSEQRLLEREAEKLLREGRMPGLAELLTVIGETRRKYHPMILAARNENKASE